MKKGLFVAFVVLVFAACGQANKTNTTDVDALKAEIAEKDSLMVEVFASINEIAANLNAIRTREGIISDAVSDGEYKTASVSSIKEGIYAIDQLLNENRNALAQLQANAAQLQKKSAEAVYLQSLVKELQGHIEEKDRQIEELKVRVEELTGQIEYLSDKVDELESGMAGLTEEKDRLMEEVETQVDNLNAAYYIVGARKDLLKNNVIYKTGAIGRTLKVNENKDLNTFVRVDRRYFTEVMIGQKNIEIVTTHPEDSYRLVKGEKGVYT